MAGKRFAGQSKTVEEEKKKPGQKKKPTTHPTSCGVWYGTGQKIMSFEEVDRCD
jgi:hypothetical protein